MEGTTWYAKQRSQMEETLWYMEQQSRSLKDYRKNKQRQWDDQAARDINRRYLNPHEEDTQQMLQLLKQQQTLLKQADSQIESARDCRVKIEKLSEEIERLLQSTQQDIQRTYSDYHVYLDNHLEAKSLLPKIRELIHQANQVGS